MTGTKRERESTPEENAPAPINFFALDPYGLNPYADTFFPSDPLSDRPPMPAQRDVRCDVPARPALESSAAESSKRPSRAIHQLPERPVAPTTTVAPKRRRIEEEDTKTQDGYPYELHDGDSWVHIDRYYRRELEGWIRRFSYDRYTYSQAPETLAVSRCEIVVKDLWLDEWNGSVEAMKAAVFTAFRPCGEIVSLCLPFGVL